MVAAEVQSEVLKFDGAPARGLTQNDVARLKAPFAVSQHEFLNGMVYIREEAISNRLDEIDPNWSFEIVAVDWRKYKHCVVTAALTVKGTRRENAGENEPKPYSRRDNETLEQLTARESGRSLENIQKAATTDALKRCARLFGVGRYLLSAGNVKNERQLAAWLQRDVAPKATPKPQAEDKPEAEADNGDWKWPAAYATDISLVLAEVQKLDDVKNKPHARNIIKQLGRAGKFGADMTLEDIIEVVSKRKEGEDADGAKDPF